MDLSILLLAPMALALLVFLLIWTFGTSPVGPNRGGEGDGLLVEVGVVPLEDSALVLRRRLAQASVRATISGSAGTGYRILVFPADEIAARTVLSRQALG